MLLLLNHPQAIEFLIFFFFSPAFAVGIVLFVGIRCFVCLLWAQFYANVVGFFHAITMFFCTKFKGEIVFMSDCEIVWITLAIDILFPAMIFMYLQASYGKLLHFTKSCWRISISVRTLKQVNRSEMGFLFVASNESFKLNSIINILNIQRKLLANFKYSTYFPKALCTLFWRTIGKRSKRLRCVIMTADGMQSDKMWRRIELNLFEVYFHHVFMVRILWYFFFVVAVAVAVANSLFLLVRIGIIRARIKSLSFISLFAQNLNINIF